MEARLGELLLKEGAITPEQLQAGLETQRAVGGKLGVILVKLRILSEERLSDALARQLGIPKLQLTELIVSPEVSALLDVEFLEKHMVLPLGQAAKKLRLALADPLDDGVLAEVGVLTGMALQPCVATRSDIQRAIGYYCHAEPCEELRRAEVSRSGSGALGVSRSTGAFPGRPLPVGADPLLGARFDALVEILVEKGILERQALEQRLQQMGGRGSGGGGP